MVRDIAGRREAEARLRALNRQLEDKLLKGNSDLQAAYNDLETFTYSVSHDLRAPLRAMSGYAGILLEDYSTALPEEAQSHLKRINENAKKMGELINDLLHYARLGRAEVSLETIDNWAGVIIIANYEPARVTSHEIINKTSSQQQQRQNVSTPW